MLLCFMTEPPPHTHTSILGGSLKAVSWITELKKVGVQIFLGKQQFHNEEDPKSLVKHIVINNNQNQKHKLCIMAN